MMKKLTKTIKTEWPPPKQPPIEMYDDFTMFGRMPLDKNLWYFQEKYLGNMKSTPITKEEIQFKITARALRWKMSTYGIVEEDLLQAALIKYSQGVQDKIGLDFGSSDPWITSIALLNGASKMYMFDYIKTVSLDDEIETLTQLQLYRIWHQQLTIMDENKLRESSLTRSKKGRKNHSLMFDFAISFSSIEHSGLGRFGDPLNPYGDLEAMAQMWCVMKPGAILFLNVPFHQNGSSLVWNAHRIYGYNRLQHLTANWKILQEFNSCQLTNGLMCDGGFAVLWVLERV
ncbi:uncharacterized protein LOC135923610 [Gordionus sp. m RMFG-2023]|uniref:uncharacterized protein LOC135923610 n=1 Tax=Gordionus sp. m RMFG-2023 TaxID=3053472 RepID=UPI0031FCF8F9